MAAKKQKGTKSYNDLLSKALNYPATMIPRLQTCWGCRNRCRTGLRGARCWNATPWPLTWGVWLAAKIIRSNSVWSRNEILGWGAGGARSRGRGRGGPRGRGGGLLITWHSAAGILICVTTLYYYVCNVVECRVCDVKLIGNHWNRRSWADAVTSTGRGRSLPQNFTLTIAVHATVQVRI